MKLLRLRLSFRLSYVWYILLAVMLIGSVWGILALEDDKTPVVSVTNTQTEEKTPPQAKPTTTTGTVASEQTQNTAGQLANPAGSPAQPSFTPPTYVGYQPNFPKPGQYPDAPPPSPLPTPSFNVYLSPPPANAGNSHGFIITTVPDPGSPQFNAARPFVVAMPNGLPCNSWDDDHSIYLIYDHLNPSDQLSWGWSCNPFVNQDGTMPYGEYPVVFGVSVSLGGPTVIQYVTGYIVYREDQTEYENIY